MFDGFNIYNRWNSGETVTMPQEVYERMRCELEELKRENHDLRVNKAWEHARKILTVKKVIFNPPATIIFFDDGTKTVVKCIEDDTYDYKTGLILGYLKRRFKGAVYKVFADIVVGECENGKNLYDYLMYQTLGWKKYKEFLRKWLPAPKYKEVMDIWEPKEKDKKAETTE